MSHAILEWNTQNTRMKKKVYIYVWQKSNTKSYRFLLVLWKIQNINFEFLLLTFSY